MQLTIPLGSEVNTTESKTVKIRIPKTNFWVLGEQLPTKKWNAYIIEPGKDEKELVKTNITTKAFSIFSNIVLKTPFPYQGKIKKDSSRIKQFIIKITNK